MSKILSLLGVRESKVRPSFAHHIRSVTDLSTGETVQVKVQVTGRDRLGRIRTTHQVRAA